MFKSKKIFLLFSLFFLFSSFLIVKGSLANNVDATFGIDYVEGNVTGMNPETDGIKLSSADPRTVAVKIINVFLGLLGIIAVSLIIYGGFIWMTSGGNEEKVTQARRILRNATIGLAIILASWGIVSLIFRKMADTGSMGSPQPSAGSISAGLGAMGNCSLESVYPEPGQKAVPRNTMIVVNFKEAVSSSTINNETVTICPKDKFNDQNKECSELLDFNVSTNDDKIFVLSPDSYLGNENGFSDYVVYLSSNILKLDENVSIFSTCSKDSFWWEFEVSNILDLTPPKIESIFPQADNEADTSNIEAQLAFAVAKIGVINQPQVYQAAQVLSNNPGSGTTATTTINLGSNYNGQYSKFKIVVSHADVDMDPPIRVQLSGVNSNNTLSLIGSFDSVGDQINFPGFFSLKFNSMPVAGNYWNIEVQKKVSADTIKVGPYLYTFVDDETSGYNIKSSSNYSEVAEQIQIALSSHPSVNAEANTAFVNLTAKVGGVSGNNIHLSSSNPDIISINPFTGGSDFVETIQIKDKKDKPMNTVIQINFNEAVNPAMIVGESHEVVDKIRVVDVDSGDYIEGSFSISSNFKTVEFKSSNKCGVNGCGEDIFCLPPLSNIKVELIAAGLYNCSDNIDCSNKAPFSTCSNNICVNADNKRYPLSNLNQPGVMDMAANSFDGNSDGYAYGPATFYNKNEPHDPNTGDNFKWFFWTNNKIETAPPEIESVKPRVGETGANIFEPIVIDFNKLMMASTLRTGQTIIGNKTHHLITLSGNQLVGYWISAENKDVSPIDGEPDKTTAYINHDRFFELSNYTSQVGSGVRDIYQNCFKPSAGPGSDENTFCTPTAIEPFCCNGVVSSSCE